MSLETGGMPDHFMVQRVPAQVFDTHDHRLLHLVAGNFTDPGFPVLFHFLLLAKLPFAYNRVYPGDPFPDLGQFTMVNQLPGRQLEAQVKQLLVSFLQFFLQLGVT
jgi:hypothetical protein